MADINNDTTYLKIHTKSYITVNKIEKQELIFTQRTAQVLYTATFLFC